MSNFVTNQVQEIFSSKQEWESFLLLCQQKDAIRNDWFCNLKSKVNEFALKTIPNEWGFVSWGLWDFRWFIKEFGGDSLSLWHRESDGYNSLCLWANGNLYDREKIFTLLQESKYSLIESSFDRIDDVCDANNDFRFIESGNYSFADELDSGRIDINKLAWYANYRTDELAEQIVAKVNRFITNPEITKMFIEINKTARKNEA